MIRAAFVSVVPSPYQRDLFAALAARPDVDLRVFYMEKAAPDSPWPERPLASYERYLRGFWFHVGNARVHWNWGLPRPKDFDVVVCNTLMSITGQWLMRGKLRGSRWMFWGEKPGPRSKKQNVLSSPLRRAAGIAAIGTCAEREYGARFPGVPIFNIPYHCDLKAFQEASRTAREPGAVTFLFCGQMIARKGLDHLLTAFATLPKAARLLLVGREAELPQMLAALPEGVRARVRYAGFQAPEALPVFFAQADVFILPSRYDGWGVVVNQALGAGLPIIASDQVGAAHDLVVPGENGFHFPSGDATALAEIMRRFVEQPELCEKMSAVSKARAGAWTPELGAERWVKAMEAVCK